MITIGIIWISPDEEQLHLSILPSMGWVRGDLSDDVSHGSENGSWSFERQLKETEQGALTLESTRSNQRLYKFLKLTNNSRRKVKRNSYFIGI